LQLACIPISSSRAMTFHRPQGTRWQRSRAAHALRRIQAPDIKLLSSLSGYADFLDGTFYLPVSYFKRLSNPRGPCVLPASHQTPSNHLRLQNHLNNLIRKHACTLLKTLLLRASRYTTNVHPSNVGGTSRWWYFQMKDATSCMQFRTAGVM
jgi:hypothetical protein